MAFSYNSWGKLLNADIRFPKKGWKALVCFQLMKFEEITPGELNSLWIVKSSFVQHTVTL